MKRFIALFMILSLTFSLNVFASEEIEEDTIEPRSSYVFSSVGSSISKTAYGGDCVLVGKGSGTLTIRLQKYSSGSWSTVSGTTSSKSFSDTKLCAHSKSKILSAGKYRCKTTVTATVGSHSDSRTVYSSTLTISSN
ncbi:MAG: hypothetical protein MR380_07050 [Lachnospiraceae bacterium]|nr:hypothetical protein [Lachnospiraceae bacterium]